nr:AAA domain-containing protein [Pseudosporangium ferrugineum]
MQYGYPVVALPQKSRQVRLAPLLVCDLTVGEDGLAHPAPPQPSPALIDHFQLSQAEADQLRQEVAERIVPGDQGSLAGAVDMVAATFGLKPVSTLDPAALVGSVQAGPVNGVQNAGMLFAAGNAESPERQLIEDLRDIVKNAGKIASTALGTLADRAADEPDAEISPVALSPVNEAQEEIIRAAMSRPLTVAQGPPGTGKSQLVTAVLATATAAGQSVLTDPARLAARAEPATRWVHVPGGFRRGITGSGCNDAEAEAVVTEVRRLREEYPYASIGVVTPLAEQQRVLDRALRAADVGGELVCATIHKFQGSEKDIMVVSPVGAHGISDRTRGWLADQTNLWNVAITRARSQLIVVGDRSWWSGQRGLLAVLAVPVVREAAGVDPGPRPVDRLVPGLRAAGLTVEWGTPLPGYPVDLTVTGGKRDLAVLIDDPEGEPDGRALRRTLTRLDIIAGAAEVRRIPVWRCLAEPEQVVAELRSLSEHDEGSPRTE